MLSRTNRLVRGDDYRSVVRRGTKSVGRHTITYLLKNPATAQTRFGFITAKTVGSAVKRNLVRRRLKAACYVLMPGAPKGADVVIRALPGSAEADWATLRAEIERGIRMVSER